MQLKKLGLLCTACILFAGCGRSSDNAEPLAASSSTDPPPVWSYSGTVWNLADTADHADWAALSKFFEQHPSYTDSAEFAGEPAVYRGSSGSRLFIWIRPVVDGFAWQLIRQQGHKFHQESGTGNPWDS